MLVGIEKHKEGSTLIFPWDSRVAAAVFPRGKDWWIVFSDEERIDTEQLKTILPEGITDIHPYSAPGYTVLRLTTNGKVALSAGQRKGRYDWHITASNVPHPLAGQYSLQPVTDAPKPYIRLTAYDAASPLQFTDPTHGDTVLAIPSFEASKAYNKPYSNPELAFLPATQGIALRLSVPGIRATQGRDGIRITTEQGLTLSPSLPQQQHAEPPTGPQANVMFPYAKWKVLPKDFAATRKERTLRTSLATADDRPAALYDLVTLYLGQGMAEEALSLLTRLKYSYPEYYQKNELALTRAAANFMVFRMGEAAADITSEEIQGLPETQLWKEAIGIFVPQILEPLPVEPKPGTPAPVVQPKGPPKFDYLGYNQRYISHYPPSMRQKLAIVASDNFVANGEFSKAARTLDILNKDGLLKDIQLYAEYLLGKIAADTGKPDQAIDLWKPLANQDKNLFIRSRAAFSQATLEYNNGKRSLEQTIDALEKLRIVWRGDTLEQNLLSYLGQLYYDNKDYANALRTWKEFVQNYGGTMEAVTLTKRMSEIFDQLFNGGLAADMPPIKSLALFYEFRDLTPIGEAGDTMIQKLADRLAQMDLLDQASALLEHQVKFRLQGEPRSRVGAQLALLQLLNKQPKKALEALEMSGYGALPAPLAAERNRLTAMALSEAGKPAVGLEMLATDRSLKGQHLRLDILWDMQDWPNVINVAEDVLGNRPRIAAPLSAKETEILLKLALAYSFENDSTQLKYLSDYYSPLLADSPYKEIFAYITNDASPIDREDFAMVTQQISNTESFLKTFRDKIAAGRLSTIGTEEPEEETTAEETTEEISARNRPLVPEATASQPPAPATDTAEPATAPPQNAPVAVEPAAPNEAVTEATPFVEPSPVATEEPSAADPADGQSAPASPPPSQTAPQ